MKSFAILWFNILFCAVNAQTYHNHLGEEVSHEIHHSPSYRRLQNEIRQSRNLQQTGYQYLNSVLQQVDVSLDEELALPDFLGIQVSIHQLACGGLSVAEVSATNAQNTMTSSMLDGTISCTATLKMKAGSRDPKDLDIAFGTAGDGMSITLSQVYKEQSGTKQLEIDNCDADLVPSLQLLGNLDLGLFGGILIGGANAFIRLVAPAVGGVVGGLLCGVLENLGTVVVTPKDAADAQGISSFIRTGGTNVPQATLKQQNFQASQANEKTDWMNFAEYENEKIRDSRYAKEEMASGSLEPEPFDFASSLGFNSIQAFINTYLGNPGKEPRNLNRPVINEAMEKIGIALGDPTGNSIPLDSLLAALPPLSLPLFNAVKLDVAIKKAAIRGLNTFTTFDILRPTLNAKTTLDNKIAIGNIGIDITIDIAITPLASTIAAPLSNTITLANQEYLASLENDGTKAWTNPNSAAQTDGGDSIFVATSVSPNTGTQQSGPSLLLSNVPVLSDTFSISLDLEDLLLDTAVMIAIDTKKVGKIPMKGILADNILDAIECLTTPLYALQLATLATSLSLPPNFIDLDSAALGAISNFITNALNSLVGIVTQLPDLGLKEQLGQLLSGILQQLINSLLEQLTGTVSVQEACGVAPNATFVQEVEVVEGDIQQLSPIELDFLMNQFLSPKGDLGFNRMVEIITLDSSGESGVLRMDGLAFQGTLRDVGIDNDASFSITADVLVRNLTSIGDNTTLFGYPSPLRLSNYFSIGPPLDLVVNMVLDIGGELFVDGKPTHNEVELVIGIGKIATDSTILLQLDTSRTKLKTVNQLLNSECPLESIQQFAIELLDLGEQNLEFSLRCGGQCDTQVIDKLGNYLKNPANKDAINAYLSGKLSPFISKVITDDQTWKLVDENILNGPLGDCSYSDGVTSGEAIVGFIVSGIGITMAVLGGGSIVLLYRAHRRSVAAGQKRKSMVGVAFQKSLVLHPTVSRVDSIFVTFASIVLFALFAVSLLLSTETNLSLVADYGDGATNRISPSLPGGTEAAVADSNPSALLDTLVESQAFLLVLTIGLFSGALPFAWLISLLFAWICPTTILTPRRRSKMLTTFSSLGKLTMTLPFMLLIILVAVRVTLIVRDQEDQVIKTEFFVTPSIGVFLFMASVLLTHILTRRVISLNRTAMMHDGANLNDKRRTTPIHSTAENEALKDHKFTIANDNTYKVFKVSTVGHLLITVAFPGSILLVILGCAVKLYSVLYGGVVGGLITIGDEEGFSLFGVLASIQSTVDVQADGVMKLFFSILAQGYVVLSVMLIPIVQMSLLAYMYMMKLTIERQRRLFQISAYIQAFGALEVMVLTIFVMALQINSRLIQAFINNSALVSVCGQDETGQVPLVRAANEAQLTEGASSCLEIDVLPLDGAYLLLLVSVLHLVMYETIMRATSAAIEDRDLLTSGTHFRTDTAFSKSTVVSRFGVVLFGCARILVPTDTSQLVSGRTLDGGSKPGSVNYVQQQGTKQSSSASMNSSGDKLLTPMSSHRMGGSFRKNMSTRFTSNLSKQIPWSNRNQTADLPPGWKRIYDPNTGRYYYANRDTGVVTWNVPGL